MGGRGPLTWPLVEARAGAGVPHDTDPTCAKPPCPAVPNAATRTELAALLALFDIAEDYVEAKRKLGEHHAELGAKVRGLRDWVDHTLKN